MKAAIVTGGSSGIGAATARELSRRGWAVTINFSRNAQAAQKLAAGLPNSAAVQGDVARDEDCRRVAAETLGRWGRIDALVNNAGATKYAKHADLDALSAEDFELITRTNVVGPFQMVRACAAELRKNHGAIVNVSSMAGLRGTGSSLAYATSKAGLNTMTLSLARSLAPEVRVNTVCPGHVRTAWHEQQGKEAAAEVERRYAANAVLKRVVAPDEVADAIVWLIEGARAVTGQTLAVDAGMHLALPK